MRDFLMRSASWAVLTAGLLATFLAWRTVNVRFEIDRDTHFDGLVDSAADALRARIGLAALVEGAGRALFDASKVVERVEFRRFVESLSHVALPGGAIMGFVEVVHGPARDGFLEGRRADGAPDFEIAPAGDRPIYYPIKFVEPEDSAGGALGLDIATDPIAREAYETARDTGNSAFFGPVDLREDEPVKEPGFALVLPIYPPGVSSPHQQGRRRLGRGWFYLAFHGSDIADILDEALDQRRPQLSLAFEGTRVDGKSVTIYADPSLPADRDAMEDRRSFEMAGVSWSLFARTTPHWIFAHRERDPRLILVAGIVVSLALFTAVQALSQTRRRAESLAREMTADLRAAGEALLEQHSTLARANRLAAVGEMAAGLAHELRNPLAGIQMSLQNLRDELEDTDHAERLEHVLAEVQRLTRLLNRQLEASRHAPEPLQPVEPADLVRDLFAVVRHQVSHAIALESDVPSGMVCQLPPDRMRQALLNLILNSVRAIGDGDGEVRVAAERSDGCLRWIVSDDGPGFAEELLAGPVGPFVTRREDGTGLGLATVRRLVNDLQGDLKLENRDEGGARVVLELPFVEA